MQVINKNRGWISWLVILSFLWLVQVSSLSSAGGSIRSASDRSVEKDGDGSGAVEKVSAPRAKVKKKSILPWILAGVGVVAAAAAYYFLVVNKKYTLTVSLGEGVSGTPAAGSQKYKKGTRVDYSYTLSGGYKDIQVTLDGQAVASSGTVEMKADHTLSASSTKVASIAVTSTPAGAKVYDNGVDTGQVTNTVLNYNSAGQHRILVRMCGYKDVAQTVQAEMGTQKTVNAVMTAGIHDDFETSLSSCWKVYDANEWSVSGGLVKGTSGAWTFNTLCYNTPLNTATSTTVARINMVKGSLTSGATFWGILLSEETDMTSAKGYLFILYNVGYYMCRRMDGFNFRLMGASSGPSEEMSFGAATNVNLLNGWNTFKVVRSGNNYSIFFNDVLCSIFTSSTYTPRYVSIGFFSMEVCEAHIEFVTFDPTAAALTVQKKAPGPLPKIKFKDKTFFFD